MAVISVTNYPTVLDAWNALQMGDTIDFPLGTWDVEPYAVGGYPALRMNVDNVFVRLAPGAVLRLKPGGRDGMVIGSKGATGSRVGLTIYGGGRIESWSEKYPAVIWAGLVINGQTYTSLGMNLDNIEVVGGGALEPGETGGSGDCVYVGSGAGDILIRGCALRNPYRYAFGAGKGSLGYFTFERTFFGRPGINSAVPNSVQIETEAASPTLTVSLTDHCTFDGSIALNGVASWLLDGIVLQNGIVQLINARNGNLKNFSIRWKRPPGSSGRCINIRNDSSGSVIEDGDIYNEPTDIASNNVAAISVGESNGITLRDLLVISAEPGPAIITKPDTVVENVEIVYVPAT